MRAAFTLIEALIAIAISAVVMTAAVAALRVAQSCVSTAQRMALENACLRAGYQAANLEADLWTAADDPTATLQPLRAIESGEPDPDLRRGLPFTRFAAIHPTSSGGDPEREIGWNGDPQAWSAHEPRSWWRGNKNESWWMTRIPFGRYGIFANTAATVALPSSGTTPCWGAPWNWSIADYGAVRVPRGWQYNQMRHLIRSLGYYGGCEYLPANAIYAWYDPYGDANPPAGTHPSKITRTNPNGMPHFIVTNAADGGSGQRGTGIGATPSWEWFANWDWDSKNPTALFKLTNMSSYGIVGGAGRTTDQLIYDNRRTFNTGFDTNAGVITDFNAKTTLREALLPLRPAHWPALHVRVQRYLKSARPMTLCRVQLADPISGAGVELSFTSFGTTLRGARQQRHRDGGWARWDDDGSAVDPTLDSD